MDAGDAAREPDEETLALRLRRGRVHGPGRESLEQRLAIASILAATGPAKERPRLGRLEVQSRIGSGGMGVVYRAYDPDLGRLVAVKLLRGFTERARRTLIAEEARALARLNHPNVVAVYDIVDSDRELYFVMEYVPGGTLRRWLDAHPEATWREVLDWFVQAGRGLVAAHGAGIVHQDFKPENVLVGTDGRVRVADFGLARRDGDEGGIEGGTPHYMAPEVRAGDRATTASDQYSYCKALSDALAATKDAPVSVRHAIERGTHDDPAQRHPSLAALLEILEAALETRPETRTRALLLERVERLWLSGVLDRSLGGGGAIELALREAPELVEPPWKDWDVATKPARTASSRELQHLLNESNGSLLITGPPGSGKTTLLLLLCRELWRTSTLYPEAPAPAVLSLSTYEPETRAERSASEHFGRWIVDELVTKYGLPRPTVRRWFDESGIVLMLDGLDETDPQLRGGVVETLNRFREDHPLPIVVTCRDSEYEALDARLAFGGAVRIQPLDDAGMTNLVEERRAVHLMAKLARNETLRDELRNPLMLTLYASTERLDDAAGAPGWAIAYEQYVDEAFAGTAPEERRKLESQLGYLARAMRENNTSDLWLERLHFGWLEHRWEEIAAYVTGVVAVLLFGVGLNLAQVPVTGDPLASALTFGLGVSITSFAYTRGRIKPVERLRWSWRRALRLLPITTVCATVVGLAEALRVNFAANIVGAGITGAILALVFALEAGDTAARVRPNAGIRRSLDYALGVSLGFGVGVGLLFAFVINPYVTRPLIVVVEHTGNPSLVVGVAVGLFVFTALFLIYGGFTVLMHGVLRLWLAWRTPLPLALPRMLARAVELGLMRRVGGGYVFLHRTLLDYFADRRMPSARG